MSLQRTAKEIVRDLITKSGLNTFDIRLRKARGQNVDHLLESSLSTRFAAIYKNRVWLRDRTSGSLSGEGSDLDKTEGMRQQLPEVLKRLGSTSILDLGCGDFNWAKDVVFPCPYIGADIVEDVIGTNNSQYGSESRSFRRLDATVDPLPRVDTVLCREVLFHLSFKDIQRVVRNVRDCGCSHLIATNDPELTYNADIVSGDYRMLNLQRKPFYFPAPEFSIADNGVNAARVLSVWSVKTLPA